MANYYILYNTIKIIKPIIAFIIVKLINNIGYTKPLTGLFIITVIYTGFKITAALIAKQFI